MTYSNKIAFNTIALAVTLNLALGLSGVSLVGKASPDSIKDFSMNAMANFGVTQEVDSHTRVASLNGTYRAEATPNKLAFKSDDGSHNGKASEERTSEVSNVFANYSKTFQMFAQGY